MKYERNTVEKIISRDSPVIDKWMQDWANSSVEDHDNVVKEAYEEVLDRYSYCLKKAFEEKDYDLIQRLFAQLGDYAVGNAALFKAAKK